MLGSFTAEHVFLNGNLFAKIANGNIYYYHNDHLGTPQKMTNSSASVVWYGEFLPFGEPLSITGSITNNLRFPGQYYDEETGLHYNYLRDYEPMIGRYVESDPIGVKKGQNHLYLYVGSNPINDKDPKGLWKVHGMWCGPNWTGGREEQYDPAIRVSMRRRRISLINAAWIMIFVTTNAGESFLVTG